MPRETPDAWARSLDLLLLPLSAPEENPAGDREGRKRDRDREEHAARAEAGAHREKVCERDLPEPEDEEVDDGGRPEIGRAVERLHEHHAPSVEEEPRRNDAQALRRDGPDGGVLREEIGRAHV